MKLHYLFIIALVLVFMVSCVAPPPLPSVPPTPPPPPPQPPPPITPSPTPAPAPTPTPEPPTQITKSGSITRDETWSGEVYIVNGVDIAKGVTLTVEPGTVVKFKHWRYGYTEPNERGALIVRGTLQAVVSRKWWKKESAYPTL